MLLLRLAAPIVVVALLAGCSAPADPAEDGILTVVASTNVYGDLASTIGGPDVEVTSIIDDPSQDPHGFEANPRVQLALAGADIVIANGGGYDDFVTEMLSASGNDTAVLIDAVEVSGLTVGDDFNEHVWYDYPTVGAVVERIADVLAELDPAGAERYRDNGREFLAGLAGLEDAAARISDEAGGAGVIVTEPVPLYLLEACGLDNLTPAAFSEAIEDDVDVAPALLQDVLDILGDRRAELVVYNAQTGGPQTDAVLDVAGDLDIPAIAVTETLPVGSGYLDWQRSLIRLIGDALGIEPAS